MFLYLLSFIKKQEEIKEVHEEEKEEDEKAEEIMEQCDDLFYENEVEINHILEQYAKKIEL